KAMIGHSIGEYVAACLAGVFTLEDALALVATRGRLMQSLPAGAMLAVSLPESELADHLTENLSLAAINAPALCVVSGPMEAVDKLEAGLAEKSFQCRRLHTSHAFHSAMMDGVLAPFTEQVKKIALSAPKIPFISNVTGTWITDSEATDPNYWALHLRSAVRFGAGVRELLQEPSRILLEIGPGQTLSTLARACLQETHAQPENAHPKPVIVSSLRPPQQKQSDVAFLLNALARIWLAGVAIDWPRFHADEKRARLPLPTYPFERKRYWIEPQDEKTGAPLPTPALQRKPDIADWFYAPSWSRTQPTTYFEHLEEPPTKAFWLIFSDTFGLGDAIAKRLRAANRQVVVVEKGEKFARKSGGVYAIDPHRREDYNTLIETLVEQEMPPGRIVHLWSTPADFRLGNTERGIAAPNSELVNGFFSLLFLAQALGNQKITHPLHISVVTSNVFDVIGEASLMPQNVTVLGICRTLPFEYPHITCRAIDLDFANSRAGETERLGELLLAECEANTPEQVVAYRN
ncbi:MAG: acyltransferase domain-containing protein, partial [Methyloligellaceae bacterium]